MAGTWTGTQYNGDGSDETVTGTAADEVIATVLGKDVIYAGDGNDTVDSGMDSDTIYGGAGDDLLYDLNSFDSTYTGLVGKDRIFGGLGNDNIWFNSVDSPDAANGGAGIDTLVVRFDFLGARTDLPLEYVLGEGAIVQVNGIAGLRTSGFERLVFVASDGDDILTGGALGDSLYGGKGRDVLSGRGGNDLIDVGQGSFTALGGTGTDTLVLDLSADVTAITLRLDAHVAVSTANTTGTADGFEVFAVTTGDLDDRLTGGAGNDSLNGGNGADALFGADGDDVLTLGQGAGRAYGGDGNDRILNNASFFNPAADPGDVADGGAGNDVIAFALGGSNTGYGGTGDDSMSVLFDGSTFGAVNRFFGGDGNDTLGGGNGADHLIGGDGDDVLSATQRVQEMLGGRGNDTFVLNGLASDPVPLGQILNGGTGQDKLGWTGELGGVVNLTSGSFTTSHGSSWVGFESFSFFAQITSALTLTFGAGDDRLEFGSTPFAVTVAGGAGSDTVVSRAGQSVLTGGAGDDHLSAPRGTGSVLRGGLGNDFIAIAGAGQATLAGDAGFDIAVFGESVVASLVAGTATGASFSDVLTGFEGLTGSSQNDTLIGNGADNQIFAGFAGQDLITTGGGADKVVLYVFQSGTAHVTDFNPAKDTIALSGFNFGSGALANGPLDAAHFQTGSFATAPTSTQTGAQFFYDPGLGNLWMDRDGTGFAAPVLVLVLDNHPALDASDLIVGDFFFR